MKPDFLLLVVDVQRRLVPHIHDAATLSRHCTALVRAADLTGVPVLATEQNPGGLGATVDGLLTPAHRVIAKDTFDATRNAEFIAALPPKETVLFVAGAEAHVCVLLSVLGLLRLGYRVELVADALGSRNPVNKSIALERAQQEGARLTTTETAIFNWLGSYRHPAFREALALVK
ncbi:nicotinamidase-related amidase [Paraburkholderia sp. BL8N3]|nr:isochorismatase family protein [Paraburkholderia sp. BL8N3]TCK38169.1 nicotinamidase-related amidase [Paraburkholderia sp. BL8N3]